MTDDWRSDEPLHGLGEDDVAADTRRMQAQDDYDAAKRFYDEVLRRFRIAEQPTTLFNIGAAVLAEWRARAEE